MKNIILRSFSVATILIYSSVGYSDNQIPNNVCYKKVHDTIQTYFNANGKANNRYKVGNLMDTLKKYGKNSQSGKAKVEVSGEPNHQIFTVTNVSCDTTEKCQPFELSFKTDYLYSVCNISSIEYKSLEKGKPNEHTLYSNKICTKLFPSMAAPRSFRDKGFPKDWVSGFAGFKSESADLFDEHRPSIEVKNLLVEICGAVKRDDIPSFGSSSPPPDAGAK
jgi:hypothetical protein